MSYETVSVLRTLFCHTLEDKSKNQENTGSSASQRPEQRGSGSPYSGGEGWMARSEKNL